MEEMFRDVLSNPPDTPKMFQLRLQAEQLTLRRPTSDFESMESLDSSPDTILYPHQVHAAHFAVSNPMRRCGHQFILTAGHYEYAEQQLEERTLAQWIDEFIWSA